MKQLITNTKIKLRTWYRCRSIKNTELVSFIIHEDEDGQTGIEATGNLIKHVIRVEETLKNDPRWTEDHLLAFYNALLDMEEDDELTQENILMCLSPENYFPEDEEDHTLDVDFIPDETTKPEATE